MSEEIKIRIVPTGPRVIDCNASWDDEKQPEERVRALRYGEFVYCSRCRRNNCQDESHKKQPEAKARLGDYDLVSLTQESLHAMIKEATERGRRQILHEVLAEFESLNEPYVYMETVKEIIKAKLKGE